MSDDSRQVREQRRTARIKHRDQLALLAKLMSEPVGREWVYDFLSACHIFHTSFATNALSMAHNEGERNVGLRLLGAVTEAAPDLYLQMLKEAGNERNASKHSESDTDSEP